MQLLSTTTKVPKPDHACADAVLDALPEVMRFVRKHMRSHRGPGLSVPQFRAMVFLRSTPDAKLSTLAEFLGASMPTTSRIVSGLVSRGLVRRCQRSGDRRCVELALTSRGASAAEKARLATSAELSRTLVGIDPLDMQAIVRGMIVLRSLFAPVMRVAPREKDL